MVSLPTSSDSDSVDSRDSREREMEYYREIYGSDSAAKCTEEKRDWVWDWAISADKELETLRKEHAKMKDVIESLAKQDANQQIALRNCIPENGELKRRLKWHQAFSSMAAFSTMACLALLIAVAWCLWVRH